MHSQRPIQNGVPHLSLLGPLDLGVHLDYERVQRRINKSAEIRDRNHNRIEGAANSVWDSDILRLDQPPFGLYPGYLNRSQCLRMFRLEYYRDRTRR